MSYGYEDRVAEVVTAAVVDVGSIPLSGISPAGCRRFSSAFANGSPVFYKIETDDRLRWEIGLGSYDSGVILRDGDFFINSEGTQGEGGLLFGEGVKVVECYLPAARALPLAGGMVAGALLVAGQHGIGSTANAKATGAALEVTGGLIRKVSIHSSSLPVTGISTVNDVIVINKSTGSPTSVPLPVNLPVGHTITIKDGRGDAAINNITCTVVGGGTIDGIASHVMNAAYQVVRLIWNGTQWNKI